jgi:hypothetical protein
MTATTLPEEALDPPVNITGPRCVGYSLEPREP